MSAEPAAHYCPGCGARQRQMLRYPWYFCADCLQQATDGAQRPLTFGNIAVSGGFAWRYAHETDRRFRVCRGALCLIHGRPVAVHEARFGGVVAEPWGSAFTQTINGYWRLTRPEPVPPPNIRGGGIG